MSLVHIQGFYNLFLIITIIVMLILAGVSLNALVGDSGIITNAQNAKMLTSLAELQEQIDYLRIEKMKVNDLDSIDILDFSISEYPTTGFLRKVNYASGETYVFDMNYIDRVGKELTKNLSGGFGINGTIYQLKDVYGINEDFKVWYRDSDGKIYGVSKIKEIPINPDAPVTMSKGLMESMGLTEETANVGNTRGKTELVIDSKLMTTPITNLDDLSLMPNIKWLKLNNLNLENLDGLQYETQLEKITLNNTTIANLDGLSYASSVTGFYLINGSVTDFNMANITNKFKDMPSLSIVRIRNNVGLTQIPALKTLGNVSELWIEENQNLTNIYGLSTVEDKTKLNKLYLNENNITDIVNTTQVHEDYGYLLPLIDSENVINMSYLNEYSKLSILYLAGYGGGGTFYENNEDDWIKRYNKNIHYLNGIDKNGKDVGIKNLSKSLTYCNFEDCDILDIDKMKDFDSKILKKLFLKNNNNFNNTQVNLIAPLLNSISYTISGKYSTLLDTNRASLSYNSTGITDLSFLSGNKITKSLSISREGKLKNSDMNYIGQMTQLTSLTLTYCVGITDFSFLRTLVNLTSIELSGMNVRTDDLKGLSYAKNVVYLRVYDCCNIDSVSFLNEFPNANSWDFRGTNISENEDLSIFNTLKNTKYLLIDKGNLTTMQDAINYYGKQKQAYGLHLSCKNSMLKKLEDCTKIENLYMSSASDTSTENFFGENNNSLNLNKSVNLKEIYFKRTGIEEIIVDNCSSLESVTVYDMERGLNWNFVPDLSKNHLLKYLNLNKNYLEQENLAVLSNYLKSSYNENSEVISGCPILATLYLNQNRFSTLAPLSEITSIKELYVTDNQLINLTGIENMINLTTLDIRNNAAITNIQPVLDLKAKEGSKLNTIYVKGCNGITSEMIEKMESAGIKVIK